MIPYYSCDFLVVTTNSSGDYPVVMVSSSCYFLVVTTSYNCDYIVAAVNSDCNYLVQRA